MKHSTAVVALVAAAVLSGCATTGAATSGPDKGASQTAKKSEPKAMPKGLDAWANPDPFPSTYKALPGQPTAIVGATVLTATGAKIENGTVLFRDGKLEKIEAGLAAPAGYAVVDGRGKYVTPGVIDAHSHLGVYPSPGVQGMSDGNEATSPNTAQVWSEHSLWPQDPGFNAARAGGVTTLQILPGSANLFGGRSVTIRNVPSVTMQGMKFPGAPYGLKMACGENPSRVYGGRNQSPATGMGNMAGYRAAWINAADYARKWDDYRNGTEKSPPKRDLQLDTLAGVLKGEITVQNHCYRADEMAMMIDLSKEFGYKINAFHHASESYKIADRLREEDICSATWAGWWGFKMESLDGIEENAAMITKAGACAVIHSDDDILTQRLNQEAAVALGAGRRAGIDIPEEEAIKWITANPAKMIGILKETGTLEAGKRADVVVWSADPFSIYAKAEKVYVDGGLAYDRNDPNFQPKSDFQLGQEIR
ncbi:amidohydrolase [Caulobacter sp. 17J80-11]|uniref:amidohydrolase n=1 Tax=Caulobacter sp. 17J80-11 TaxID=2763502 RepID=UPI001653A1B3|nr:amidohydrolase [Caulobacter sp. 17J80-11]MBC6981461.1 amidohydrolase [Caulobacter sp. 17J80-11]